MIAIMAFILVVFALDIKSDASESTKTFLKVLFGIYLWMFWASLLIQELSQLFKQRFKYFKSVYNICDAAMLYILFEFLLCDYSGLCTLNTNFSRQLYAVCLIAILIRLIEVMKTTDLFSFYVNLIEATFLDMTSFIIILLLIMVTFSMAIFLQDMNSF